jgi:hypothetical protein
MARTRKKLTPPPARRVTNTKPLPLNWQQWCSRVLEPAVLEKLDAKDPDQTTMAGALKEIAAAAFTAGTAYGHARATHPEME